MTTAEDLERVRAAGLVVNGVDALTGLPATPPLSLREAAAIARNTRPIARPSREKVRAFDLTSGFPEDMSDLSEYGWAVVFAHPADPAIVRELTPLLELRRKQAKKRYRELVFDVTVDTYRSWLDRHGCDAGHTDSTKIPYYLLLVGTPTQIPFEFQFLLGLEYAVGRVDFATLNEYGAYARTITAYEALTKTATRREIVYWGPDRDDSTRLSRRYLLDELVKRHVLDDDETLRITTHVGAQGTKQTLLDALHREGSTLPPSIVFTASHGAAWPSGHELQAQRQGALLTQEWDPETPVETGDCVGSSDIDASARVHGSVVFSFACYGAGTPLADGFSLPDNPAKQIAPTAMTAALPQRLLARDGCGALGFIGHVDRAWSSSLIPLQASGSRIGPFRNMVMRLLKGNPLGYAARDFPARWAALVASGSLSNPSLAEDDEALALEWIEATDARNYAVLGDPAARLRPSLFERGI